MGKRPAKRSKRRPARRKGRGAPTFTPQGVARKAGLALGGFCALLGLLQLSDGHIWLGTLATQLDVVAGMVATLALVLSLWGRGWGEAAVAAALAGLLLWPTARRWLPVKLTPGAGPSFTVQLVHSPAEVDPDVDLTVLLGGTPAQGDALSSGDVQIRTRLPRVGAPHLADNLVATRLAVGRCELQLVAFDVVDVWQSTQGPRRREQLQALRRLRDRRPALWLGDLGGNLQTADVKDLMADTGLRDSRRGFGRLGTQPAAWGPLSFDVDHLLVRGWVAVLQRATGGSGASNARTSTATLQLTDPRCN